MSRVARGLRRGLWRAGVALLIVAGTLASVAMLAVTMFLSAKVALAVLPAAGPAQPAAAVARKDAEAAKPDDAVNTSVANSMTAVGTAVAAVTLILSLGTTWFAMKLKDVDEATSRLRKTDEEYVRRLAAMSEELKRTTQEYDHRLAAVMATHKTREDARQLLTDAKFALLRWVNVVSLSSSRYSVLADLSAHLEVLMSESPEQRRYSFAELIKVLPDTPDDRLMALRRYCAHCHTMHGGTARSHGVWCDIFSPVERAALAEATLKDGVLY